MLDFLLDNFELVMSVIVGIWVIELCVFVYCLLHGRRKRSKKRKNSNERKAQNQKKDFSKASDNEPDIIDLDDDEFTYDFIFGKPSDSIKNFI